MGTTNALSQWKPLLIDNGFMMLSDLVWLTDTPNEEAINFWQKEYPDMQPIATRLAQINTAGFDVIEHFTLSKKAWQNYYEPLKARVEALRDEMPGSVALEDISKENNIYTNYLGQFGYQMFILRKRR